MATEAFRITVDDTTLSDLRARVANARFATSAGTSTWAAGASPDYLRDLAAYWATGFDWPAAQARLNEYPQFLADVDGTKVHFVHIRGRRSNGEPSFPLLLAHGWPSSFVEMLPLVPLLRDGYDLVIPSLPGFLFSERTTGRFTRESVADLWHKLMVDVLDYTRYGAFGGDIGGAVVGWLGAKYPSVRPSRSRPR